MTNPVTGVVSEVSSRPWTDPKTNKSITLYSFQLEGSKRWYRTGTTPLPVGVGQAVRFILNGQNVDMDTFEAVEGNTAPAPRTSSASSAGAKPTTPATGAATQSRDGYWAEKERRDIEREQRYQEVAEPRMALSVAVEAASRVVVAGLQTDTLNFGTTAKGKRYGMLAGFVKEIATELALFIQDAPNVLAEARAAQSDEAPAKEESDD